MATGRLGERCPACVLRLALEGEGPASLKTGRRPGGELEKGTSFAGKKIVCIITGNGLKDTEIALKNPPSILELPANLEAIEKALGWA